MGQAFARPPETVIQGSPLLRTPFTDVTASIGHHTGRCLPFNLRWVDCLEAHGPTIGKDKCATLYQDFCECTHKWKQSHRMQDMRTERDRQYINGLLGKGPRVSHYDEDAPSPDSFLPDFDTNDP